MYAPGGLRRVHPIYTCYVAVSIPVMGCGGSAREHEFEWD
jgi:hypothetical protein